MGGDHQHFSCDALSPISHSKFTSAYLLSSRASSGVLFPCPVSLFLSVFCLWSLAVHLLACIHHGSFIITFRCVQLEVGWTGDVFSSNWCSRRWFRWCLVRSRAQLLAGVRGVSHCFESVLCIRRCLWLSAIDVSL